MPLRRNGPWYRGGISPSYIPPTVFVSVGYAICIGFFAVFCIFAGTIMTVVSYEKPKPPFDDPFFTKNKGPNVFKTIGPVLLGVGLFVLLISIGLCVTAACLAKKQEDKRHKQQSEQPLTSAVPYQPPPAFAYPHQPPPASAYPHQLLPTSAYPHQPPPASAYPHQPPPASAYPHQQEPENIYPPPSTFPTQPYESYTPADSYPSKYPSKAPYYCSEVSGNRPPPSGNPYPPPSYTIPENSQYVSDSSQPPPETKVIP